MKPLSEQEDILEQAIDFYEGITVKKNSQKSINLLMTIADYNKDASFYLGRIYWNKKNNETNNKLAIKWYTNSAKLGHPFAQLWLGHNYLLGTKSKIDAKKCCYWYKKAAAQNIALAQYHAGMCYFLGYGTNKNFKLATLYMKKAAKNNFYDADVVLLEIYKQQDKQQYILQQQKIDKKYSNLYNINSEISLKYATYILDGFGFEQNKEKAFNILNSTLLKSVTKAQLLLAKCYEKGLGTNININKAKELYKRLSKKTEMAKLRYELLVQQEK